MEQPWVLRQLGAVELRDFDCDAVRGSLVDWVDLRDRAQTFDLQWTGADPPVELCPPLGEEAPRWGAVWQPDTPLGEGWAWDMQVALGMAWEAADECSLGLLAVAAMLLVCNSDCGDGPLSRTFETIWRELLVPRRDSGREPLPAYLLASTSWPVARILGKWGLRCARRAPWELNCTRRCGDFLDGMRTAAGRLLMPLLTRTAEPPLQIIYDGRVDTFLRSSLRALGSLRRGRELHSCPVAAASHEALLLYARFLGAPVVPQKNDPLMLSGGAVLSAALCGLPFRALLRGAWHALAAIAGAQYATWRSHRLFPTGQVTMADIRHVITAAAEQLPGLPSEARADGAPGAGPAHGSGVVERTRVDEVALRALWRRASAQRGDTGLALGSIWRRVARWLLEAPEGIPATVCLSMAWGGLQWVAPYLRRAMQVGVWRFVFATPDMLQPCNEVAMEQPERWRLLCVRVAGHFYGPASRPYDINNYAKFFMLPLFLALGVDVAWLDVDIFLFRDPVPRLLVQAYDMDGRGGADVLTTDHFDYWHLNHGVFFVRASDRTLVWATKYIRWLHTNPVAHDQNGWDAFVKHTVMIESMVYGVDDLVTYKVLDTTHEYITLSGWAGSAKTTWTIQLLHFTGAGGSMREKISGPKSLVRLFNATTAPIGASPGWARLRGKRATLRLLQKIQRRRPRPAEKGFHYEGVHEHAFWPSWNENAYHQLFA